MTWLPLMLICTHMKLGKDGTHGRDTSSTRNESFRHLPHTRNRARGQIAGNTSIHAHCKAGLRSIWLFIEFFFLSRTVNLRKAGLRRFAWTTELSGSGGVVCGEIEYVSKDIKPQHGVRCQVSAPSSPVSILSTACRCRNRRKTSHCIYLPRPQGSAPIQGNTCS